jgi:hypothetical protein
MPTLETGVANQEINKPTLKNEAGHGKVLPPTLKPVTTPTMMVFLTQLAASKAAGVAGILLSHADNGGLQIEELNSAGEMIVGFTLYAVGDANTQKTTGVAVIQMGSSNRTPSPFTPEQRSAWSLIANELQQYQALNAPKPAVATEVKVTDAAPPGPDAGSWITATLAALACAVAAGQGFANPLSDAACIGSVGGVLVKTYPTTDIPADPPVVDVPPDGEPIDDGTGNSTSQDGNNTSGRDGGDDGNDGGTSGIDDGGTSGIDDGGGAGCFVAGTPVRTSDGGWKPIEDIALEAQLASCDEASGEVGVGAVTRLFSTTSAEIVTVTFHKEKLGCTPRHRFFTDSGWLAARHLSPGIKVQSLDGEMRPILAISNELAEVPVFNMRVDSQHTYFVGETGYLVHNEKDTGEEDDGTEGDGIPGSTDDKERSLKKTQPVSPPSTKPKT